MGAGSMLTIKPSEVKAVANLLMQEHDDVDTLAKLVIATIDNLRAQRETYVLVGVHPSLKLATVVGPYSTDTQAMKDSKLIGRVDDTSRGYLARMKDPCMILVK